MKASPSHILSTVFRVDATRRYKVQNQIEPDNSAMKTSPPTEATRWKRTAAAFPSVSFSPLDHLLHVFLLHSDSDVMWRTSAARLFFLSSFILINKQKKNKTESWKFFSSVSSLVRLSPSFLSLNEFCVDFFFWHFFPSPRKQKSCTDQHFTRHKEHCTFIGWNKPTELHTSSFLLISGDEEEECRPFFDAWPFFQNRSLCF